MIVTEEYRLGQDRILSCVIPQYENWVDSILNELNRGRDNFKYSHPIGGRWENSYLSINESPSVRVPMRLAREIIKEKWQKPTIVLYESPFNSKSSHPPFWFNIAKFKDITGVHDHAQLASFSGVVYLQSNSLSGHLYFPQSGGDQFSIIPEVGKMVLFPSHVRHGVHSNRSNEERISLAFNLYPFPLPSEDW
ncbi:MAG: putative 2OG-Fe(II) oxygenase [Opitutales bacterium]|nr:putative 2OG-Fe(II) oxygenase [Opitutales bacterium]